MTNKDLSVTSFSIAGSGQNAIDTGFVNRSDSSQIPVRVYERTDEQPKSTLVMRSRLSLV